MIPRRRFLVALASATAPACAPVAERGARHRPATPCLEPLESAVFGGTQRWPRLKVRRDQLMRVTVCTRPFRPAGPRLDAVRVGNKTIIHNYGHGGAGWSLSWGCAADAAALAGRVGANRIAVIGAGVIGLTTAIRLIEVGASVTIYAREFPAETRSARATGVWSPSSRIGLGGRVDPSFVDRWQRWARRSHRVHQQFIGTADRPVDMQPNYSLGDDDWQPAPATHDFLSLDRRLKDIQPTWSSLDSAAHPFPVKKVSGGLTMVFNIAAYMDRLMQTFLLHGGKMIRVDLPHRKAALALPEPTIVNCSGYGAKSLWAADELIPVRGQLSWLAPQPEANYGFLYRDVYVTSRGDGLIVQCIGPNDDFGFGVHDESPNLDETEHSLATVAPLLA